MDLENFGNGALVAYLIITPVLLVCYVLDGRFAVQSLFLEYVRINYTIKLNNNTDILTKHEKD
jgi:hypothetical protein